MNGRYFANFASLVVTLGCASMSVGVWRAPQPVADPAPATADAQPEKPPAEQPGTPVASEKPAGQPADGAAADTPKEDPAYVLGFTVKDIDGRDQKLDQYKGKVVLIVNVASRCGYTPQYEGLERLYQKNRDAGLVILGFPANNFNGQEPGTDAEIKEFCSSKYGVTFPMFSKISVTGQDQHPLYKKLAGQPAPVGGDPKWNFTKFLVDRQGNVVARFSSNAKPDEPKEGESKAMAEKIEELLKAK